MKLLLNFVHCAKFLRAYKKDVRTKSGTVSARQELIRRFNANKFWWQHNIGDL